MAEQPDPTPEPTIAQRGADPMRVIARLKARIGELEGQVIVCEEIIEEQEAALAELPELRAELVRLSRGGGPDGAAEDPEASPAGDKRTARSGSGRR